VPELGNESLWIDGGLRRCRGSTHILLHHRDPGASIMVRRYHNNNTWETTTRSSLVPIGTHKLGISTSGPPDTHALTTGVSAAPVLINITGTGAPSPRCKFGFNENCPRSRACISTIAAATISRSGDRTRCYKRGLHDSAISDRKTYHSLRRATSHDVHRLDRLAMRNCLTAERAEA
jgi:hypothetical protein